MIAREDRWQAYPGTELEFPQLAPSATASDTVREHAQLKRETKAFVLALKANDGNRNRQLNDSVYRARKDARDLSDDAIREAFRTANAKGPNALPFHEASATIESALQAGTRDRAPAPTIELEALQRKDGAPVASENNLIIVLRDDPRLAGLLRYNECLQRAEWREPPPWKAHTRWDETEDKAAFSLWTQREHGIAFVRNDSHLNALGVAMHAQRYNPWMDHVRGLVRDPRVQLLDHWLEYAVGAQDDEYHRLVARRWMLSLIARSLATADAPIHADNILLLMGKQGIGKNRMLDALVTLNGVALSVPVNGDIGDKDTIALTHAGSVLVVLDEHATANRSDARKFKSWVTLTQDKYRLPYARYPETFPRRFAIAGTTNDEEPLSDGTGDRRWFPVRCAYADVAWLEANRDQLLAEARDALAAGEIHYITTEEQATICAPAQESAREERAETVEVRAWLARCTPTAFPAPGFSEFARWDVNQWRDGKLRYLQARQVRTGIGLTNERNPTMADRAIGSALRVLGWKRAEVRTPDGKVRAFVPEDSNEQEQELVA